MIPEIEMSWNKILVVMALLGFLAHPVAARETHSATVLEVNHTDSYTFILVDQEGTERWVAAKIIDTAPGDTVEYAGGTLMRDFHSKSLDKTFEEILFLANIRIAQQADAGDQMSIAELYANRADLAGKTVTVRALVRGVLTNVQGKNWVTVSDGTGIAPDDTLLAVTTQTAVLGEALLVQGTVRTDVNVSPQHQYKVVIEDAEFVR
jgi:hypothetical protein